MSAVATNLPFTDPREVPVAPSVEEWRAMTALERDRFVLDAIATLNQIAELMPEGQPHVRSKSAIRELLGGYFQRVGRKIYLASELAVHYPGQAIFAPDLMAVLDVEDPGDEDERMSWIVADEGRGLDLVIEVLYRGDRQKDLATNVVTYARLGIPEYFVYDRLKHRLHGWRLPYTSATKYDPISRRGARLASRVLGLDLGLVSGRMRFFTGGALVPATAELLEQANGFLDELEARAGAESARAEAESARAEVETARADTEAARAEAEAARADTEAARADAEAAARAGLEAKLAALEARLRSATTTA